MPRCRQWWRAARCKGHTPASSESLDLTVGAFCFFHTFVPEPRTLTMKKLLLLASLSLAVTCSAQDGTFIPGHMDWNGVFIPGHYENYDMNGVAPQAPRQMYVAPVEPDGYGRYLAMQYLERERARQYRKEQAGIRYFYRKLAQQQRKEKRAAERAKRK